MKTMMKCDSSGMESAKMAMGFARLMMVGALDSEEAAKQAAAEIDAIVESLEKARECSDYRATYGKILAFSLKYEKFDIEAELQKPDAKEFMKQFSGSLNEQLK